MKCNICGHEFGDGIKCQHCTADRVLGLGVFSGFNFPPRVDPDPKGPRAGGNPDSGNMLCFSCGEIIPSVSEYCPHCGKEQYVKCPKCGLRYLSQYPICYQCGTNREFFIQEQKAREAEERRRQLEKERREAEERRLLEEARKREAEELRKRKEKEMKEAEELRKRKEKERREAEDKEKKRQEHQRQWEINWVDAFLYKERDNVVREINNDIIHKKKEHTQINIVGLIISCVIGVLCFLIVSNFSGSDYHDDIVGICYYFVLPCCALMVIGFGIALTKPDNTSPRDRLINLVKEKYYSSTKRIFNYMTDDLFERLLNINGIVYTMESLSLSGSDIIASANVYIQKMITDLNKKKDFESKSYRDKLGLFKNYLFNNTILSPDVEQLVNAVFFNSLFWDSSGCTNRVAIRKEIERKYLFILRNKY